MKEIYFELVKEYNEVGYRQRFYKASLPLLKSAGMCKDKPLAESMLNERSLVKPEYKHLIPDDIKGVDLVCVSDAYTHTERLVFAGLKVGDIYGRLGLQIDGKHTYMTDGGDSDAIYDDEVYLRHLSKLSGYKYKGIRNEHKV